MFTKYMCNICGAQSAVAPETVHRELVVCPSCGSNARFRALMAALSKALTGGVMPLTRLQPDRSVRGWGCSDSPVYANRLAELYDYTNTFHHTDPRVDVCDPQTLAPFGNSRFILCSDVLEHVLGDPAAAVRNMHAALAPGGCLILSAPTYDMDHTIEKYPSLRSYAVVPVAGRHAVVYETTAGALGFDPAPAFHGGPGNVMEMRLFSHAALVRAVRDAGFRTVSTLDDEGLPHGAVWPHSVQDEVVPVPLDGRVIWAVK